MNKSNNIYGYYQSPIGLIEITVNEEQINSIKFVQQKDQAETISYLLDQCREQLDSYFNKKLTKFNLPLAIKGTSFQELVWSKTCNLPYGKTISYQELAKIIDKPKAARTVGSALRKNPLAIVIPCHRITNQNQKIGNYNTGVDKKEFLLKLEEAI